MYRQGTCLLWREHTDDPLSLDSLVLHFCSASPWTSHCKRGQLPVCIYRTLQSMYWMKNSVWTHVRACVCLSVLVLSDHASRFLCIPDLFGLASVIQREEDICILADAVIGKALQIDEEVVRHGDTAAVTMALSGAVTLGTKRKVIANKMGPDRHSASRYVYLTDQWAYCTMWIIHCYMLCSVLYHIIFTWYSQ